MPTTDHNTVMKRTRQINSLLLLKRIPPDVDTFTALLWLAVINLKPRGQTKDNFLQNCSELWDNHDGSFKPLPNQNGEAN